MPRTSKTLSFNAVIGMPPSGTQRRLILQQKSLLRFNAVIGMPPSGTKHANCSRLGDGQFQCRDRHAPLWDPLRRERALRKRPARATEGRPRVPSVAHSSAGCGGSPPSLPNACGHFFHPLLPWRRPSHSLALTSPPSRGSAGLAPEPLFHHSQCREQAAWSASQRSELSV